MKLKFTLFVSLFFLLLTSGTFAQNVGDFRTAVISGDWNTVGTWETYDGDTWNPATSTPPVGGGNNEAITILSGDSVFITTATTIGQLLVETGGMLGLAGGTTVITLDPTVAPALQNSGNVTLQNGVTFSGSGQFVNNASGLLTVELSSIDGVTTINNGTVNFSQTSGVQATLTNNSLINWLDNPLYILSGGQIINNDSISIGVLGTATLNGTGTFTNAAGAVIYLVDPSVDVVDNSVAFTNSGTLKGFGTAEFAAAASSNGTYASGNNSAAILTLLPATVVGTPTFRLKLFPGGGTPTAGTTYNQLAFSGSIDVTSSTLAITDAAIGDAANTVYTLLTSTGTITGLPGGTLPSSLGNLTNTGSSITVTRLVVLPLTWGIFTAVADNNQTKLSWTTLQESNSSRFSIERSTDGVTFTSIGTVAAKGNSSVVSSYSFTDASPAQQGFNYYRLAETDLDGKINYSLVRVISFNNGKAVIVQTSPNPVKDLLNIVVQQDNITILLSDMSGRTLKTLRLEQGFHQTSFSDLTTGIYQLTIYQGATKIDSRQILKLQ